jgi:hypothetical protein
MGREMNKDKAQRLFEMAWPAFYQIMHALADAGGIASAPRSAPAPASGQASDEERGAAARRGKRRGRPSRAAAAQEKAAPGKRVAKQATPPRETPPKKRGARPASPAAPSGASREVVALTERVLVAVAGAFGVKERDIVSKERGREIDLARAVFYYLAQRLSGLSLPALASLFKRDRVTLRSGIRRIDALVSEDKDLAARIAKLEDSLRREKPAAAEAAG